MSELLGELRTDLTLSDKEYRHTYANERLNALVATQIKVLREQNAWRQEDLAEEAEMHQPMISRYENVNYSSWSIKTLKQLAFAFDVILEVKFRSFGDMVRGVDEFSRESLQVPRFADDPFFKVRPKVLRPKIRATAIDTRQPKTLHSPLPPTGATQLSFWDFSTGSGAGPRLVNSRPRPQGGTAIANLPMETPAVGRRRYGTYGD